MSTKTYTLTEDEQGHKIRKCSDYTITDEGKKVKAVSLLELDGVTPVSLNKNFTASNSPITAESYATLISNASQVTDKAITISTESAKLISEYCQYNPTTATANTLIADANAKGFSICTTFNLDGSGLELGTLSNDTGEEAEKENRSRTKDYINYSSFSVSSDSKESVKYSLFFYGIDNSFISSTGWKNCNVGDKIVVSYPENATKFKVIFVSDSISDYKIKNEDLYTILPSLNFDGSHYVDTGINAKGDTSICIDFVPMAYLYNYFGVYTSDKIFGFGVSGRGYWAYRYVNETASSVYRNYTGRLLLTVENGVFVANGTTLGGSYSEFDTELPIFLNCANGGGTPSTAGTIVLYSATINGQLFIPSNNGTTDGLLNLSTLEFKPLTAV